MCEGYRSVYDASNHGPAWWFPAFGLGFLALACLVYRFRDVLPSRGWAQRTWARADHDFIRFAVGFAALWTAIASFAVFGPYLRTRAALRDGTTSVVEGAVEDFHPMPYTGHSLEHFRVGDVHFAYSDYVVSPGFRQTASHGGPITEGLRVRIVYFGPREAADILRLDVACPDGH